MSSPAFSCNSRKGYLEVPVPPEEFDMCEKESIDVTTGSSRGNISKLPSFSSIQIFKEGDWFLQKSTRRCSGVLLQGPRRLLRLCLFGLLVPIFLISLPLYVRMILYPPYQYTMAPTDQRLLDQKVSSIWCQGQSVHMNGSFNAFLLPDTPPTKRQYSIHHMLRHVTLKDDVKEYWGFFLQKGSIININLCTRYDGGLLMIMRGVNNLKKCAWIGEEDSAEQDEDHQESSNESGQGPQFAVGPNEFDRKHLEFERNDSLVTRHGILSKEKLDMTSKERKQELDYYVQKVLSLGKNEQEILTILKKQNKFLVGVKALNATELVAEVLTNGTKTSLLKDKKKKKLKKNKQNKIKKIKSSGNNTTRSEYMERIKRSLNEDAIEGAAEVIDDLDAIRKEIFSKVQNSSYEVSNVTKDIYMNLFKLPEGLQYEKGAINQNFSHDTSNEEHRSSFSSSEEALTQCDGLIGLMPLYPSRVCNSFNDSHTNKITYKIPITGTYYFVFSSDNEVFDSEMYFNLTLQRVVFDTDHAKDTCVNKTECSLAFSFWSHDQAVVEVPEGDWDSAYTLDIKCQPRVAVYLIILFCIPFFILFCTFH